MNCAVHPEQEATGYCRNCGKAMCSACARPVRDVLYCEPCLAGVMGHPAPGAPPVPSVARPHAPNPGLAFLLGLFPGLGAIYNGEFNKALIHIVVFIALVVGASTTNGDLPETILGFMIAGFIFYMAIDAMRTAQGRASGQASAADPIETWSRNRPVGPMILIGIGALFLLSNFGFIPWHRMGEFWPLILIGAGFLMLWKRVGQSS